MKCLKLPILTDRNRIYPQPLATAREYENINITCDFHNTVRWSIPDASQNVRFLRKTVAIEGVTKKNQGEYVCSGEMDEKYSWTLFTKVIFRAKTFLNVIGKIYYYYFLAMFFVVLVMNA